MAYLSGVAAIIAAIFSVVSWCINRKDRNAKRFAELKSSVDSIGTKLDEHIAETERKEAVQVRTRILRVWDDIVAGKQYSKEMLESCINDSTWYDNYCEQHPDFANNLTVIASAGLKSAYLSACERGDFKEEVG